MRTLFQTPIAVNVFRLLGEVRIRRGVFRVSGQPIRIPSRWWPVCPMEPRLLGDRRGRTWAYLGRAHPRLPTERTYELAQAHTGCACFHRRARRRAATASVIYPRWDQLISVCGPRSLHSAPPASSGCSPARFMTASPGSGPRPRRSVCAPPRTYRPF